MVSSADLFEEGVAYALRGDSLRAEQYLNAARERGHDPRASTAWLVRVCVASGRYKTAVLHADSYLRRHPSDWWLRFVVANIYDALGDFARAGRELEAIVNGIPRTPLPHYRLAVFYRERLVDEAKSAFHFREYLKLSPDGAHSAEVRDILAAVPRQTPPFYLSPPRVLSREDAR